MDDRQGDGATPLIVHTDQGNFEVVKLLVEFNANVDLQDQVCVCVCVCVCVFVGCCLATKSLNLNNTKWNGWR